MILTIVLRKHVLHAVQRESPFPYAIPVTPNNGPKVGRRLQISFEVVESRNDVAHGSGPVGDFERNYNTAVGGDSSLGALGVRECVEFDGFTLGSLAPGD